MVVDFYIEIKNLVGHKGPTAPVAATILSAF